jgi:hypothetical protein
MSNHQADVRELGERCLLDLVDIRDRPGELGFPKVHQR